MSAITSTHLKPCRLDLLPQVSPQAPAWKQTPLPPEFRQYCHRYFARPPTVYHIHQSAPPEGDTPMQTSVTTSSLCAGCVLPRAQYLRPLTHKLQWLLDCNHLRGAASKWQWVVIVLSCLRLHAQSAETRLGVGPTHQRPSFHILGCGPQLKPGKRPQTQFPYRALAPHDSPGALCSVRGSYRHRIQGDSMSAGAVSIHHSETRGPRRQIGTGDQEGSRNT